MKVNISRRKWRECWIEVKENQKYLSCRDVEICCGVDCEDCKLDKSDALIKNLEKKTYSIK